MILEFQGEYRFLSNFWPAKVELDGVIYPSVEHAYQAAKTTSVDDRNFIIASPTPGIAKQRSKEIVKRPEWEFVKLGIMWELVTKKFIHYKLRKQLLAIRGIYLREGNTWHDNFWGVCTCARCGSSGRNYLGRILMNIRDKK